MVWGVLVVNILLLETDPLPGDRVLIGDNIEGTVEELVFASGMSAPFVLVEYWHERSLMSRRFHAADCRKTQGGKE